METYGTPQIRALTRASRAFLQAPPDDFGTHGSVLTPRGVVYIAAPDQGELLEQTCLALHPHAPGLQRLDHAALMARLPLLLRADAVGAGLAESGAADIDVHALHQGYLRSLRQHGGQLRSNAGVVALQRADGLWTLALQDGASVQARLWSTPLAPGPTSWASGRALRPSGLSRAGAVPLPLPRPPGWTWQTCRQSWQWTKVFTSSPTPASCWARRPTPIRWTRTTCSPKSWTWLLASFKSNR